MWVAVHLVVLARFGLLALISLAVFNGLSIGVLTFDTSRPYFTFGLFLTLTGFALAFYGWKVSLGGRSLMRDAVMD